MSIGTVNALREPTGDTSQAPTTHRALRHLELLQRWRKRRRGGGKTSDGGSDGLGREDAGVGVNMVAMVVVVALDVVMLVMMVVVLCGSGEGLGA